jgi:2-haloacid dehalogenase
MQDHNFERRFSVDQAVRRHKPAPEACAYVEKQLGVAANDLLLIACHTWDTLGALEAGWHGALIKRTGNDVLSVGPQPEIVGQDLHDVANQLIERYRL